jgi:cytochrome d ubiquinol oxidase subunit II
MATLWFWILAGLLIGYAVLDGFDLGAGAAHLWLARSNEERRMALGAIGPVWDGNEVWLIAWGGALFLAFPRAYAVGFSGFYLALVIVLWLLMGRGIAIEFRHHIADPMWRGACDVVFSVSSLLLALLYGVAAGNVVSGVPLDRDGYFQGLFAWMLNPYALLMGVFSVVAVTVHGAHYLWAKTAGALEQRAERLAVLLWLPLTALAAVLTAVTVTVRPELIGRLRANPFMLVFPVIAVVSLGLMRWSHRRQAPAWSFVASSGLIAGLLASTGAALYPDLLPARPDPARSLTVANAAAAPHALAVAALWMLPGVVLLGLYQVVVYRTFRGRVVTPGPHY